MVFGGIFLSSVDGWVQAQEATTSIIEIDKKI